MVDDLPQVVAALDAVFDLAEDLSNLIFNGVRPGGFLLEAVQVREHFLIDDGEQVVAAQGGVVVDLAVFALRRCPAFPPVWLVEDVGVFLAVQLGFGGFVAFEGVEVFQEEQPGGLFGVVEFACASGVFLKDVVDVLEGLFKHGAGCRLWVRVAVVRVRQFLAHNNAPR